MAIIGMFLFCAVLAASIWAIVDTVAPRWSRIVALLDGSAFVPAAMPMTARRAVRRIEPARTFRQPLRAVA